MTCQFWKSNQLADHKRQFSNHKPLLAQPLINVYIMSSDGGSNIFRDWLMSFFHSTFVLRYMDCVLRNYDSTIFWYFCWFLCNYNFSAWLFYPWCNPSCFEIHGLRNVTHCTYVSTELPLDSPEAVSIPLLLYLSKTWQQIIQSSFSW